MQMRWNGRCILTRCRRSLGQVSSPFGISKQCTTPGIQIYWDPPQLRRTSPVSSFGSSVYRSPICAAAMSGAVLGQSVILGAGKSTGFTIARRIKLHGLGRVYND